MKTINNIGNANLRKYVVARVSGGELWYYGTWDDENTALDVARELGNGCIIPREAVQKGEC